MGITGLLPLLSSIQKPCNLKTFRGLTLGVDVYVWLHRAAVASAMDIGLGKPTTKFIAPVMNRVRMLLHFGITPYLVFDGDYLPSKAPTEISRANRRAESLKTGNNLLSMGRKTEAHKEFIKAIDITPEMARLLIEELKRNKIQYVVAPYEADAQLAYLEREGMIHGVISEDSDLLVFGIKRLLTKLDEHGDCIEINRKDFSALRSIHIAGWTDADFRRMAILSGCDYLPNIEKIGLKTAYQLVRKHKDIDKIVRVLSFDGKYTVPPNYLAEFTKAELTFLHQRVYCPRRRELIMLNPFDGEEPEDFGFIGKHVEDEIAQKVAAGELDPTTKKEIKLVFDRENYRPSPHHLLRRSKSVQTPAELKGKSIGDFFRSNRVPLAELDPNSFTPSPSQRRVLERHPASVLSTPIDTVARRPITTVSSAPAGIGVARSRNSSGGNSKPLFKRQRLCAEDESALNATETKSRFFSPSASDPTILKSMQKKEKASDELWSDESFEEALSQLPDDLDTPSNPSRIRVFSETDPVAPNKGNEISASQTSSVATLRTESSSSSTTSDIQHSFTKQQQEPRALYPDVKASTKKMTSSFAELAKKYTLTYGSTAKTSTSPALARSSSAVHTKSSSFFTPTVSRSSSRLSLSTSITDIVYPSLPVDPDSELKLPLLIPESPNGKAGVANDTIKGSEDCIVPCSDIESEIEEALAWEEEQAQRKSSVERGGDEEAEEKSQSAAKTFGAWDLARFAFTG